MTIQGDFTNKPNSGCLTPEINRQMADNTARIIKKADEAVDKFIKSDEGIEKKNSLKKKIGAGILAFAGIGAVATWAIKSGKLNKIKNLFTKKASNVGEMAKKGADEATEALEKIKTKISQGEVIDNNEFKLLKNSGLAKTYDWIGGSSDFSAKVKLQTKKGDEILKTFEKGHLKEIVQTDSSGKLVKKVTYGNTMVSGDGLYKFQNRVIENADGTTVKRTIGNIEGNGYVYFKATDNVVAPTLYHDALCQKPIKGTSKEVGLLQEYLDKYNQ